MKKKTFKILISCLIMVACIFSTSVPAMASNYSTGKAVIPTYYRGNADYTEFWIANITDEPLDVTITLYNQTGSVVTDDGIPSTGAITVGPLGLDFTSLDYNDNNTGSTATFTLDGHCSLQLRLNMTSESTERYWGYGIIKWEQDSTALQGLVVSGGRLYSYDTLRARYAINVNGGLPF